MQKLDQTTQVEIGTDGSPVAIFWRGKMVPVKEVLDRWNFVMPGLRSEQGREYFSVRLTDRTNLKLHHDLSTGKWVITRVQRSWFRSWLAGTGAEY